LNSLADRFPDRPRYFMLSSGGHFDIPQITA
jgi:hypothetical protein